MMPRLSLFILSPHLSRAQPHNKSLDASGGSASLNLLGAAKGALIRAAASTLTLACTQRKLGRRHNENQQSGYDSARHLSSLACFGSWLFLLEKGNNVNNVAFVVRRGVNRFKRLLSPSRGRYVAVQIYNRRRQAI